MDYYLKQPDITTVDRIIIRLYILGYTTHQSSVPYNLMTTELSSPLFLHCYLIFHALIIFDVNQPHLPKFHGLHVLVGITPFIMIRCTSTEVLPS